MYCPNCGAQNSEDATHCVNCGNELRRIETPRADVPPRPEQPGTQASYAAQSPQPSVPNYLVPAILTTIFCCLPLGIVSIVYAAQVNGKVAAGDRTGALQSSRNARTWAWVAFGSGIVVNGGFILFSVLASLASAGSY